MARVDCYRFCDGSRNVGKHCNPVNWYLFYKALFVRHQAATARPGTVGFVSTFQQASSS